VCRAVAPVFVATWHMAKYWNMLRRLLSEEDLPEEKTNNDMPRRLLASSSIPMFSIVVYLFSSVANGE
jgi:hypothetical protein